MIETVCFIVNENMYDSKRYFVNRISEALVRAGVHPFIFDAQGEVFEPKEIFRLHGKAPDFTCSFNNIYPMKDGQYLWDKLETPHFTYLVDTPIYWIHLARSPYSVMSCIDRDDLQVLESLHFDRTFFLPHAVEKERVEGEMPRGERPYDVVMIGSCYDHESMREAWQKLYSKEVCKVIDDAIDVCFALPEMTFAKAVHYVWSQSGLDPKGIDFEQICECVDMYTRGRDRIELIRAIEDVDVHIFGKLFWEEGKHMRQWSDYLGDRKNVHVHDPVPYDDCFELLAKSKVSLHSTPSIRNGSHERYFNGLAMGCTVLGSINRWIDEQFGVGHGIYEYQFNRWDQVNGLINDLLSHEESRLKQVELGRRKVAEKHTWDHRVETLLTEMPKMIEKVRALAAAQR